MNALKMDFAAKQLQILKWGLFTYIFKLAAKKIWTINTVSLLCGDWPDIVSINNIHTPHEVSSESFSYLSILTKVYFTEDNILVSCLKFTWILNGHVTLGDISGKSYILNYLFWLPYFVNH